MTTALAVITDALNELGVYAPGEPIAASDSSQCLDLLNRMIDAWADEFLFPTIITAATVTLTNGVASYTVGPGGAVNVQYPQGISYGPGVGSVTASAVTTPANVVSAIEWNMIESLAPGAGVPNVLFYDPQYPLGVLNVAPTPNGSMTASVPFTYPLTSFPAIFTNYTMGQGVFDALVHNLCVTAKPYFAVTQMDPNIAVLAVETKDFLRYSNRTSRAFLGRDSKRQMARAPSAGPPQ